MLPTGAGTAKQIDQSDIQQYWYGANWTPDGKQIVFSGNRPGHAVQCFAQDVDGGKPRPVTPEGVIFCEISPDGKLIAGNGLTGSGGWLYPIEGGQERPDSRLAEGRKFHMDLRSSLVVRVSVETIAGQGLSLERSERTEAVFQRNDSPGRRTS